MYRLFLRLFLLALFLSFVSSGSARAQINSTGGNKYWVFFADKALEESGEASIIHSSLRPEALRRRALRGNPVRPDLDAQVNPAYISKLENLGIEPVVTSRWLNAISAVLDEEQIEQVRRLPFVTEIREVAKLEVARVEEVSAPVEIVGSLHPFYGRSYLQLALMNAIAPLERGINGSGVRLGFLDTDFLDFQHPVFDLLRTENRVLADSNFIGLYSGSTHGFRVASTAVGYKEGELIGPAWGAYVLAATTEYAPTETNAEEDYFVRGLEWLESMGVDVVNVSLGYTTFDQGQRSYTYDDLDGDTAVTTRAVDIAVSLGVVVVTSAGNEGADPWRYIGTPADADSAIAVGAVLPDSTRAPFSSFGPTADGRIKPDVAALGAMVANPDNTLSGVIAASPGGNYSYVNGTSFSSPLVAGVVCQMLQVNPELTPGQVIDILRRTSSQADNPDNELGWGIVNADAAVREAEKFVVAVEDDLPMQEPEVRVYPNPTYGGAVFEIGARGNGKRATLRVYDVLGRQVAVPFNGILDGGTTRIEFDGSGLGSGIYVYVLESENLTTAGKLVLIQ